MYIVIGIIQVCGSIVGFAIKWRSFVGKRPVVELQPRNEIVTKQERIRGWE